jgi:hypothetical protein
MLVEMLKQHAYRIAIALFMIFLVNVLVGKISMELLDYQLPLGFDGVVEFLVMCAACIFFVIGILRSENLTKKNN